MDYETKFGVCDVHKWALKDLSPRQVYYCNLCDAWICEECNPNIPLRAIAMVRQQKDKLFNRNKTESKTQAS